MQEIRPSRSDAQHANVGRPNADHEARPAFERTYDAQALDLDDLAQAIRLLLAPDEVASIARPKRPVHDLLLGATRATHGVEETRAT